MVENAMILFMSPCQDLLSFVTLILAILSGVRCNPKVHLIYISLID